MTVYYLKDGEVDEEISRTNHLKLIHILYKLVKEVDGLLNFDMIRAKMLAENIRGFMEYVNKSYQENNTHLSHPEKLYRLKHLTDEFKLYIIADELIRINRFVYDKKYTAELVDDFKKALTIIGEYIDNNENDLFIFTPRLHTLRSLCSSFTNI